MNTIRIVTLAAICSVNFSSADAADLPTNADFSVGIIEISTLDRYPDANNEFYWDGIYVGVGPFGMRYNGMFPVNQAGITFILGANHKVDRYVVGAEGKLSLYQDQFGDRGVKIGGDVRAGYLVSPESLLYAKFGFEKFISGGDAVYAGFGTGIEYAFADQMTFDANISYLPFSAIDYQAIQVSGSLKYHFD